MEFLFRLFSFFITFVLIGSPEIHASVPEGIDLHSVMTAKLKTYKKFSDIAADVKRTSPEEGKKLENYLREKKFLDQKLPPVSVEGREIVINSEKNIKFLISEAQEIILVWGKKKISLPATMRFEELTAQIDAFATEKSLSFWSIIINDAHAFPFALLIASIVVVSIGTVLIVDSGHANVQRAKDLKENCERGTEASIEDLVETYNGSIELRSASCRVSMRSEICTLLSEAQSCFRRRIDQFRAVNDGDRSGGKEINHDPNTDRYRVVHRANQQ